MSNLVLQYVRERDPRFKDVPDDELTLYVGERHPQFLQEPTFAKVFEARKQQESNLKTGNRARTAANVADFAEAAADTVARFPERALTNAGQLINWTGEMLAADVGNTLRATTQLDSTGPVFQGLQEAGRTVPQVAGAIGLTAAGVPAPLAFAAPAAASTFAATGGDVAQTARSASVAAVLPGAGNVGSSGAAQLLARTQLRNETARKAIEAVGSQTAVQALMEGINLPEYVQMTPEQRRESIIRNAFANLAFLPMDAPNVLSRGPSRTAEIAALRDRLKDPTTVDALFQMAEADLGLRAPTAEQSSPVAPEAPIPDPPAAIDAQLAATADPQSTKAVTLLVPGSPEVPVPQGLAVLDVPQGRAIYNPAKVTPEQVQAAGAGPNFDGRLLGMSQAAKPTGPAVAVVTRSPDTAAPVVEELVPATPEAVAAAQAAQSRAVPGGTPEVVNPAEVVAARLPLPSEASAKKGEGRGEGQGEAPGDAQPAISWDDAYAAARKKGLTVEAIVEGERVVESFTGPKAARVLKRQKGIRDALQALRDCLEGRTA